MNSDGELVEYNKAKDPEMMKAVQVIFYNILLNAHLIPASEDVHLKRMVLMIFF